MCMISLSATSNSLQLHDYSPPGSSVHWDCPSKNTGVGCHAHLEIEPRECRDKNLSLNSQTFSLKLCLPKEAEPDSNDFLSLELGVLEGNKYSLCVQGV